MASTGLHQNTEQLLSEALPGQHDVDAKVRTLLEMENLHRLARLRRLDRDLSQKYGMSFQEFHACQLTRQRDYSWAVEQDAMDWEMAISGIATADRQLSELRSGHGR